MTKNPCEAKDPLNCPYHMPDEWRAIAFREIIKVHEANPNDPEQKAQILKDFAEDDFQISTVELVAEAFPEYAGLTSGAAPLILDIQNDNAALVKAIIELRVRKGKYAKQEDSTTSNS